jgi:hypothetical protein
MNSALKISSASNAQIQRCDRLSINENSRSRLDQREWLPFDPRLRTKHLKQTIDSQILIKVGFFHNCDQNIELLIDQSMMWHSLSWNNSHSEFSHQDIFHGRNGNYEIMCNNSALANIYVSRNLETTFTKSNRVFKSAEHLCKIIHHFWTSGCEPWPKTENMRFPEIWLQVPSWWLCCTILSSINSW